MDVGECGSSRAPGEAPERHALRRYPTREGMSERKREKLEREGERERERETRERDRREAGEMQERERRREVSPRLESLCSEVVQVDMRRR